MVGNLFQIPGGKQQSDCIAGCWPVSSLAKPVKNIITISVDGRPGEQSVAGQRKILAGQRAQCLPAKMVHSNRQRLQFGTGTGNVKRAVGRHAAGDVRCQVAQALQVFVDLQDGSNRADFHLRQAAVFQRRENGFVNFHFHFVDDGFSAQNACHQLFVRIQEGLDGMVHSDFHFAAHADKKSEDFRLSCLSDV